MSFKNYIAILLFCVSTTLYSQNNSTLFFEPEVEINYKVSQNYSHSFGVEHRTIFYQDSEFEYQTQHLEFAHTSAFALQNNQSVALGIQYRFKNNFNVAQENEFRLQQAYHWENKISPFVLEQKLKMEQRFYTSVTKHRMRYQLGVSIPLQSGSFPDGFTKNENYIALEIESLFEISKTQKPEYEQRLSGVFGWQLRPRTNLEIGLEYRLADYTQHLKHELFFVTGIDIAI